MELKLLKSLLKNKKAKFKKVTVITDHPEWVKCNKFSYRMLHKRYQALLIKHLKQQISEDINSENPDKELEVFSDPSIMKAFFDDLKKEYADGFYVNISEERQDLKQTVGYRNKI